MTLSIYPEYKASVIDLLDKVPIEWELKRLGDLVEFAQGKAHEPYVDVDGEFICVNSRFVSTQGATIKYCNLNLTPAAIDDVLMVMSDLPNGRALAKAYYVFDDRKYAVNQRVCRIRPFIANSRFLFYLLDRHPVLLRNDDGFNQTHLSNSDFQKLNLYLPSQYEQTQIARFLDHETARIDALIEQQQRLIELLKEKRQAVISHAVTKGLDPTVPMKDSGVEWLGEVPAHWSLYRLKLLATAISKGTTPTTIGAEFEDFGIRFLKAENITVGSVSASPEFFISEKAHHTLARSALAANDILVVIAGATTGKSAVLQSSLLPANTNQAVSFVRLRNPKYAHYLQYWLSTDLVLSSISVNSVQSAQPNLSMENLGDIPVPVPPAQELMLITEYISKKSRAFDELTYEAENATSFLKERRSALISAAVTGRIDVRNWQPSTSHAEQEKQQVLAHG